MLDRLLVLTCELPPQPGGIGTYTHQVARQLTDRGVDVLVLATCGEASPEAVALHDAMAPYSVKRFPQLAFRSLSILNRFRMAMDECRRFDPDLVLVCDYGSTYLARALAARFGVGYVVMGHGSEFLLHRQGIESICYAKSLKRAQGYLANSRYTQRLMCDFMGSDESSVAVIPLGADSDLFQPTDCGQASLLRESLGLHGKTVMLTVGRLWERKGQDVAVRALGELATKYPHLHYVIVGQGTTRDFLAQLAADLGVEDRVHLVGFVPDAELPAYYELADLFVLPSRITEGGAVEGFGIVISEANLMGIPAVGTSGSGIEDAIVDGVTGILVKPDSVADLARGIESLVGDPDYRRTMGESAQQHAVANHTWRQTGARTLEYLKACA